MNSSSQPPEPNTPEALLLVTAFGNGTHLNEHNKGYYCENTGLIQPITFIEIKSANTIAESTLIRSCISQLLASAE